MDTTQRTVTIAASGSLSDAQDLGEYRLVGIIPPTAWTAAALTFAVSFDGTNYLSLRNDNSTGTEFGIVTGEVTGAIVSNVGQPIIFTEANRKVFRSIPYLKLRSGPVTLPVVQASARTFTLILERTWN